jgi:TPR repeat protein
MASELGNSARALMDINSDSYDLSKAAEAAGSSTDPDSKYLYALFQYLGEGNVPQDRTAAKALLKEAADLGSK